MTLCGDGGCCGDGRTRGGVDACDDDGGGDDVVMCVCVCVYVFVDTVCVCVCVYGGGTRGGR